MVLVEESHVRIETGTSYCILRRKTQGGAEIVYNLAPTRMRMRRRTALRTHSVSSGLSVCVEAMRLSCYDLHSDKQGDTVMVCYSASLSMVVPLKMAQRFLCVEWPRGSFERQRRGMRGFHKLRCWNAMSKFVVSGHLPALCGSPVLRPKLQYGWPKCEIVSCFGQKLEPSRKRLEPLGALGLK